MFYRIKNIILIYLAVPCSSYAQDPHFTQFYNSTLSVNPAYAGVFDVLAGTTNIRMLSNYRSQWNNSQSPYTTATIQFDTKLGSQIDENELQNGFNLGVMGMTDQSLNGAFKSNYISAMGSLYINLDRGKYGQGDLKSIGLGFGVTHGNRLIDLSQVSFSQQFSSGGFDLTLPSGETALNAMKPFFSVNAGLLYRMKLGELRTNELRIGISGYHLNKPKQTFFTDPKQFIPMRFSVQFEYINRNTESVNKPFWEAKFIYQNQASIHYIILGAIYNFIIGGNYLNTMGFGANYRINDAISPYVSIAIKGFKVGCSYDITTSSLKTALIPARSLEFSIQYIFSKTGANE
jgi:type IX secretion system PorP/SprF family membrane protein